VLSEIKFQVNVYTPKGTGQLAGVRIAEEILAAFPRNTSLSGVRIDTVGSISPAFTSDGWYVVPVTFQYQNLVI